VVPRPAALALPACQKCTSSGPNPDALNQKSPTEGALGEEKLSDCTTHQKHLKGLLNHRLLGPPLGAPLAASYPFFFVSLAAILDVASVGLSLDHVSTP